MSIKVGNSLTREKISVNDNGKIVRPGGMVSLRIFEERDIANKVQWINDPENNQHLHYDIPLCAENTLKWFRAKDNTRRLDYVIEYDDVPVGLIGLLTIDHFHHKAEFYISMGETAYKNRGIATEASRMLLDYGFGYLNLHKIYLNTDGENYPAHRLFEKVGFVREGFFVDDMIHRGRYIDRVRYAVVSTANNPERESE